MKRTTMTWLTLVALIWIEMSCSTCVAQETESPEANAIPLKLSPTDPETCAVPKAGVQVTSVIPNGLDPRASVEPKLIVPGLPIVGLLMYDQVLQTEITAPMDVFSKHSEDGKQMFNVITIAASYELVQSEEGLKMFPDYTFEKCRSWTSLSCRVHTT